MTVKVLSEQQVLQEAGGVLLEHLSPAKVARFWAAWQAGGGDYLAIREQLFAAETVETLFEKVQAYQEGRESTR
jgi:hypothetical protein